jgi:hypothetical protein
MNIGLRVEHAHHLYNQFVKRGLKVRKSSPDAEIFELPRIELPTEENIEKYPGCEDWLLHIPVHNTVKSHSQYADALQETMMKAYIFGLAVFAWSLQFDGNQKIPALMLGKNKGGSLKIFDTVNAVLNQHGQVIAAVFVFGFLNKKAFQQDEGSEALKELLVPLAERIGDASKVKHVTVDKCCQYRPSWLKIFVCALIKLDVFHWIQRLVSGAYFLHPQYRPLNQAIRAVIFGTKNKNGTYAEIPFIMETPSLLGQKLFGVLEYYSGKYAGLFSVAGIEKFKHQLKLHNEDKNCISLKEVIGFEKGYTIPTRNGKGKSGQGSSNVENLWKCARREMDHIVVGPVEMNRKLMNFIVRDALTKGFENPDDAFALFAQNTLDLNLINENNTLHNQLFPNGNQRPVLSTKFNHHQFLFFGEVRSV